MINEAVKSITDFTDELTRSMNEVQRLIKAMLKFNIEVRKCRYVKNIFFVNRMKRQYPSSSYRIFARHYYKNQLKQSI